MDMDEKYDIFLFFFVNEKWLSNEKCIAIKLNHF